MKIKGKILIIFETSSIRNQKNNYSDVDFGFDFINIRKYIDYKKINNQVCLAVTKFSIDEFIIGRNNEFLKSAKDYKKINNLPNVSIPKDDFDYTSYLKGKTMLFLKKNNVFVIPYPNKNRFYDITKRCLLKQRPFINNDKHSDYGFKDVIIWESILSFSDINNFKKVIFICNDNGFDDFCEKEFSNVNNAFFRIFKDCSVVIKEIQETFEVDELVSGQSMSPELNVNNVVEGENKFLQSDYFLESVERIISSDFNLDLNLINNLELSESTDLWVIDNECVGKTVTGMVLIDGASNFIVIYLDDSNSIELIEYNYEYKTSE